MYLYLRSIRGVDFVEGPRHLLLWKIFFVSILSLLIDCYTIFCVLVKNDKWRFYALDEYHNRNFSFEMQNESGEMKRNGRHVAWLKALVANMRS